jgi:hypothetical protein
LPEQQFGPAAHIDPFWAHVPQAAPQRLWASCTQMPSQLWLQQKPSAMQTVAAHWLHCAPRGVPVTQTSWSQVVIPPHVPALQFPLQQSVGVLHGAPSSEQACPQTPPLHDPLQQSGPVLHPAPLG